MKIILSRIILCIVAAFLLLLVACKPEVKPDPITYKFKVNPSSVELYCNETIQLAPYTIPELKVECVYASNAKDIAVVSETGLVMAKDSLGQAVITVTATINGEKKKARCHVYVVPDKMILTTDSVALFPYDTYPLSVTLDKAGTNITNECIWSSSNTGVATVSNGVITAVAEGECQITATYQERSVSCFIHVYPTLAITPNATSMMIGSTKQLTVNVPGATFKSNHKAVAEVSTSGLVTAKAKGEATITATIGTHQVSANISVSDKLQIALDGQTLPSSIFLCPGDTLSLSTNADGEITWSASRSIAQVEADGRLIALKEGTCKITATAGSVSEILNITILNGFKISPIKVALFAPTNLYYSVDQYRFYTYEWEKGGASNSKISNAQYPFTDLLGWGTGDEPAKYSAYTSYSTFVDWGNNIIRPEGGGASYAAGTWRTLSADEWEYLFIKRTNADQRFAFARVHGQNGLVMLPNQWETPTGAFFYSAGSEMKRSPAGYYTQNGYQEGKEITYTYNQNNYGDEIWSKMSAAGAVFLPAAGSRWGTSINAPDYCFKGYYWSSTQAQSTTAYCMQFDQKNFYWRNTTDRSSGCSVRLVKVYE